MKDFEVTLGDAVFTVSLRSEVQDYSNTESNVPHFHIDHEVHIVLEGEAVVELDGVPLRMKPSGVYVIPPNVSHYYRDCSLDFKKISFLFTLTKHHETNKDFSEYDYLGIEYLYGEDYLQDGDPKPVIPFYIFYKKMDETDFDGKVLYAKTYVPAIEISGLKEYFDNLRVHK